VEPERFSSLGAIPALLIKTSRRPNFEVTCWAAVAIDSSEVKLNDEYQYHKSCIKVLLSKLCALDILVNYH
jgi:hypothetical protein